MKGLEGLKDPQEYTELLKPRVENFKKEKDDLHCKMQHRVSEIKMKTSFL